ncbi:hypothetical protein YC2023_039561 [Brassica napus]
MSLKLVDYESLNGDVKKCQYAIRGSLLIRKLLPFLGFPKSKGCCYLHSSKSILSYSGENWVNVGFVLIPVSRSSDQFLDLPETSCRGNYPS